MPLIVDGETYLTAAEASRYLGISRPTFHQNVRPYISEYKLGAFKRTYYRQPELDRFRGVRKIDSDKEE
jgi:hypothetical protein